MFPEEGLCTSVSGSGSVVEFAGDVTVVTCGVCLGFFAAVTAWAAARCRGRKCGEYAARIVSLIHALGSIMWCGLTLLRRLHGTSAWDSHTTCEESLALVWSLSYFVVDSVGMITRDYYDHLYMLHHVACILGISYCVFGGRFGYFMTFVVFSLESTNPMMQYHWLRVHDKRTSGGVYRANRYLFLLLYALMRGLVGPYQLLIASRLLPEFPLSLIVLGAGFFVFSMQALHRILQSERAGIVWLA